MKPLSLSLLLILFVWVYIITGSNLLFLYGTHYPHGQAAVNYVYGDLGMWRNFTPAQYIWNYYNYPNLPKDHPYNISALTQYSNGAHVTTCLDANEHLLLDWNHDGEIDTTNGGYSFHEHNGRGNGDTIIGLPFNNFWFDDNWLTRYMSIAYNMTQPNGLSDYNNFTRWRIVGGDNEYWTPYPDDSTYIDQLALNGLLYITKNDYSTAITKWKGILNIAKPTWNDENQEYDYPGVNANYYLGLFAIFTNFMRYFATSASDQHLYLQHSIAIRSAMLYNQVVNATTGVLCGWCTSIPNAQSEMNIETAASNVLGLGAASGQTLEVGISPMYSATSYFYRPYHALSAVVSLSNAGYMAYGPYWYYTPGSYTAEFILRSPKAAGVMATVDINDDNSGVLASLNITADMFTTNDWLPFELPFNVPEKNQIEFRIYWYGTANMDATVIHVW